MRTFRAETTTPTWRCPQCGYVGQVIVCVPFCPRCGRGGSGDPTPKRG